MADPAPTKTLGVVTASIGSAGVIYAVVAITGYLSFGDNVSGNVVGMCKLPCRLFHLQYVADLSSRHTLHSLYHRQSRHRSPCHVLLRSSSSPMSRLCQCCHELPIQPIRHRFTWPPPPPLIISIWTTTPTIECFQSNKQYKLFCSSQTHTKRRWDFRSPLRGHHNGHRHSQLYRGYDCFESGYCTRICR